jgi:hypothetical protein
MGCGGTPKKSSLIFLTFDMNFLALSYFSLKAITTTNKKKIITKEINTKTLPVRSLLLLKDRNGGH